MKTERGNICATGFGAIARRTEYRKRALSDKGPESLWDEIRMKEAVAPINVGEGYVRALGGSCELPMDT